MWRCAYSTQIQPESSLRFKESSLRLTPCLDVKQCLKTFSTGSVWCKDFSSKLEGSWFNYFKAVLECKASSLPERTRAEETETSALWSRKVVPSTKLALSYHESSAWEYTTFCTLMASLSQPCRCPFIQPVVSIVLPLFPWPQLLIWSGSSFFSPHPTPSQCVPVLFLLPESHWFHVT